MSTSASTRRTPSDPDPGRAPRGSGAAGGAGAAKGAAVGLWVLVGGALLYGVVETVIKASALFTG